MNKLQRALTRLGFIVDADEMANGRIGPSTRAAVRQFQADHDLPVTGQANKATVTAIDAALAEMDAADPTPTDADAPASSAPTGDLPPSNPPTGEPLPPDSLDTSAFSIEGEVVNPDGSPLRGHIIRAYDRALCDWRTLGSAETTERTDEQGRYRIRYDRAQLKQWGKERADLKVEVHDPSDDAKLAESPLILQALPHEVVNFAIGEDRFRGPDEFTRVGAALAPMLRGHDDLRCLEVADVLILAREAELASSKVAYFVKAARWSAEYDAPAALFYGLMRRGEPTRIDALLARPLKRLLTRLEEATSRNIVDLPVTDALRDRLSRLQQGYLSNPAHPYAKLLGTTKLTGKQRAAFTQKLTAGNRSRDDFWQELADGDDFSAAAVADLQAVYEMQSLTGENTSLTLRLRADLAVGVPREVATFSVAKWRDDVLRDAAVAIPDEVLPSGTPAARRAAYAQMLYRAAELRYPTRSLAGQLARDPLQGEDSLQFFFTAHPEFEFRDQRVLTFLREHPETLNGLADTARDELLGVEQLFHLVPAEDRLANIRPLWNAGLRAAPQVAYLGRSNLIRRVGGSLDVKTAHDIYRKAVHVTSLALNIYLLHHPQMNRLSTTALQLPQAPTDEALARAAVAMPEWEELFGSPDACATSPCDSAISPAAYLVDTLAYLGRAVDADGNNALDELLTRRPDLGTLRLTCDNTETLVPQIDLVNEILEAIVSSADGATLSGSAIGETVWDGDLLAAQPEHLRPEAYDIVRTTAYPFTQAPFDLWAEEGRRYLAQLGIARDELMSAMPPKPGVGAVQIATEALGMSSIERDLICQPKKQAKDLAPSWGIDLGRGTLRAQLGSIETLIAQAAIDYDTVLRLLNTRFVNPDRLISVSFAGESCSLDAAVLAGEGGVALADVPFRAFLDRLHRFLRLQHRLDCSEYDLDALIHALDVRDFDAPLFVPKVAATQALRDAVRLTLPELSAWWADLDTYRFEDDLPSQYEAVFLDDALFPAVHTGTGPDLRAVFSLTPDRAELAITTTTDASLSPWLAESDGADLPAYTLQPDYAAFIQSATRLTAGDVLLLVREVLPKDGSSGHVALNLANVSLLYRMASLAQSLGVTANDVLQLVAITDVAPLRTALISAGPIEALRFHDRFQEIEGGRLSVEELAYLLLHEPASVAALAPTTTDVDEWLASVTPGFVGILAVDDDRMTAELRASVTQSLGTALGVDPAVLDALLFEQRTALGDALLAHVLIAANVGEAGLPTPDRDFATVFGQLHEFALAWSGLALDPSFLPFVLTDGPALGWFDIADPPMTARTAADYDGWSRLTTAADLQASIFTAEQSVFGLMQDAAAATIDPATFILDDLLLQISDSTGWPLGDVTYLVGPSGFNLDLPAALRDEQALSGLQRVFALIQSRGVNAEQAHSWTIPELTFAETQSIKQVLSLCYPPDSWLSVLGSIQDELRTLKRDALLGHLLTTLGLEDSDAFYRHYLIDPDGSAVDRTSRIVLAHSAVQLFAQRILLNLEEFSFERPDAEAWAWRKKYRVWEAGRKVFLWPENWLEPELRDNKSAFFTELEDALMQEDVTTDAAERIYHDYLVKLDQVSRLDLLGMYEDTWSVNDEQATNVLHIFGRTKDTPALYFYRRCEDQTRWTPWEPVPLDIQGDHLTPIVYNGRLHLFWPTFTLTPIEPDVAELDQEIADLADRIGEWNDAIDQTNNLIDESSDLVDDLMEAVLAAQQVLRDDLKDEKAAKVAERAAKIDATPANVVEIGMAWSTYSDGRWLPKHVAGDNSSPIATDFLPKDFYFTGWISSENRLYLAVRAKRMVEPDLVLPDQVANGQIFVKTTEGWIPPEVPPSAVEEALDVGYFTFDDCQSRLTFVVATAMSMPSGILNTLPSSATARSAQLIGGAIEAEMHPILMVPSGMVDVLESEQSFDSRKLTGADLSFELGSHDPADVRMLLASVDADDAKVLYTHQAGGAGNELSPFFYTDQRRCYFIRPLPDVWVSRDLDIFTSTAQRRSRTAGRMAQLSAPAGLATDTHYQGTSDIQIIDRGIVATEAGALDTGLIDVILDDQQIPVDVVGTEMTLTGFRYEFTRFHHPHTCLFLKQESRYGVEGLLNPDPSLGGDSADLYRQAMPSVSFDFSSEYAPNPDWVLGNFDSEQLADQIDFDHWSPYGGFNWEVFFHIPVLIATRLMQNQRFADARRWFHYIFDPTTASDGAGPERFWKIKPFYEEQRDGALGSLAELLTEGSSAYEQQVEDWERDPFRPDVIARIRMSAYMQSVVMRYLTCLIQEADTLFQRDTREDIDEARLLYLLAAEILGDRPTLLPAQDPPATTPNLLLQRFQSWWEGTPGFVDPLDLLTSYIPTSRSGAPTTRSSARTFSGGSILDTTIQDTGGLPRSTTTSGTPAQGATSSIDTLLLFGIPYNDKLYGFWDTVADRLFKIRHSMNLSGVLRQLALFAPPIDPALLVRASAAGLSIESILSGLFAPRSTYRFSFLLQKALELSGEARGFGGAVLAALKDQDAEQIAVLRSTHEIALLESIRALKGMSVDETEASLAGLVKSRESAELRANYYASLEKVSSGEQESLDKLKGSMHWQEGAQGVEVLGAGVSLVPTATSTGPQLGGLHFGAASQAIAGSLRAVSAVLAYEANKAGTMAGYERRSQDWALQVDLAKKEIEQLDKQIIAAEIRAQIAEADLANHEQQIAQAKEVEEFLKTKFTNQQLYSYMISKLASVHFQAYQLAYQLALQAQSAFYRELGPNEQSMPPFIKPDNWDSLRNGLLAGELLTQQLRQMEAAHLTANQRELEITKHVSLAQLDPSALLELRATGFCEFHIPEALFAMDFTGHYYRRLKAVQITIPCIIGPYANVSATLSLTGSWTRSDTDLADPDQPLQDTVTAPQVAIATSSANRDSGAFELNFNDPRYLPFEGAGAISSWSLELPSAIRPFDYETISDVVMHVSYTARDAGDLAFKSSVNSTLVAELNALRPRRLFSVRHDFPDAWHQLVTTAGESARTGTLELSKAYFPAFLDYEWQTVDGAVQPRPIALAITGLTGYLSPHGAAPTDPVQLNGRPSSGVEMGMPVFDLTSALSGTSITDDTVVTCELTTDDVLRAEDWDDLYLLMEMDYDVR
ncbi:neuraminidase-like domain-containing protein [Microbacterium pumilum]|uniref:Peptidoglycan binding-like domain-containing protein n=1 Tax=Microbacterium pumilum TaxID=344165 RepID=A0ABP5DL21_9MICO